MNKKKVYFLAQFPPPIHGLSKAVETLFESPENTKFDFEKINLTNNKLFIVNLLKLLFSRGDLYYLTISQSSMGNFRDLIIMGIVLLKRRRILIHLHGGYFRILVDEKLNSFQRWLNYALIPKLDGVIVLGDSLRKIFSGMIDEKKIYTVKNCVDNQFLLSDSLFNTKLEQLAKNEDIHILYLSNMIASKGYKDVLALASSPEIAKCANVHFDFAGAFFEKKEEDFFYEQLRKNHLENRVTYHGVVSGRKKMGLLKEATIFMLPTRYPKEGQPISILEAMGNGATIVTTQHAGIPDIVSEPANGIFIDTKMPENVILKKLTELDFTHIAQTNRRTILSDFTEREYVTKMLLVMELIVNKKTNIDK